MTRNRDVGRGCRHIKYCCVGISETSRFTCMGWFSFHNAGRQMHVHDRVVLLDDGPDRALDEHSVPLLSGSQAPFRDR